MSCRIKAQAPLNIQLSVEMNPSNVNHLNYCLYNVSFHKPCRIHYCGKPFLPLLHITPTLLTIPAFTGFLRIYLKIVTKNHIVHRLTLKTLTEKVTVSQILSNYKCIRISYLFHLKSKVELRLIVWRINRICKNGHVPHAFLCIIHFLLT